LKNVAKTSLVFSVVLGLTIPPLPAQDFMSKVMKKELRLRSVACTSCHPKDEKEPTGSNGEEENESDTGKSKDRLTPFGQEIAKLVAGQQITERLKAAKDKGDEEAEEQLEDQMAKDFAPIVKKLSEVKDADGKTLAEAIAAGEITGIKPRK
jgi:hypothetical protein